MKQPWVSIGVSSVVSILRRLQTKRERDGEREREIGQGIEKDKEEKRKMGQDEQRPR